MAGTYSLFLHTLRYLWSDQRCPVLGFLFLTVKTGIKPSVVFSSRNFCFPLDPVWTSSVYSTLSQGVPHWTTTCKRDHFFALNPIPSFIECLLVLFFKCPLFPLWMSCISTPCLQYAEERLLLFLYCSWRLIELFLCNVICPSLRVKAVLVCITCEWWGTLTGPAPGSTFSSVLQKGSYASATKRIQFFSCPSTLTRKKGAS